jgi:hypothetical protein
MSGCIRCKCQIFNIAGASGIFRIECCNNGIIIDCLHIDDIKYARCVQCGLVYSIKNGKFVISDDVMELICESCTKSHVVCMECEYAKLGERSKLYG